MKGMLYGVGVGPGDPELITLKAIRVITQCGCVAAPDAGSGGSVALEVAREHVGDKETLLLPMPMSRDKGDLDSAHSRGADLLCGKLDQGVDVAFLTLGDPSVYSTFSYLGRLVRRRGYPVELVPGVTSFCGAAAVLGRPLCEGDQPLHILPASCRELSGLLDAPGGKVLMKMGRRMERTVELLREKDLLRGSSAVRRCGFPDQEVSPDLESLKEDAGYFSVIVTEG